mgnify:CR=1 FL=1
MDNEKVKFYSPIKEKAGVVMVFTKIHEKLGFPKLVSFSTSGFDINDIEYKDELGIHRLAVEFEYLSSEYLANCYQHFMSDDKKYIVVCWEDDCNLQKTIYNNYQKNLYKVIELKNFVEVMLDDENVSEIKPNYYLLNYNPSNANFHQFSDWKHSNMYTFSNNNNIKVKNGSKVLVKQGSYIIGGFDIIRFNNIRLSNNKEVIELYKQLTDYPIGLFVNSIETITNEFVDNYIGHIFYDNLFEIGNTNLRKTVKEILPDLGISNSAIQSLTEEQYNKLIGIN